MPWTHGRLQHVLQRTTCSSASGALRSWSWIPNSKTPPVTIRGWGGGDDARATCKQQSRQAILFKWGQNKLFFLFIQHSSTKRLCLTWHLLCLQRSSWDAAPEWGRRGGCSDTLLSLETSKAQRGGWGLKYTPSWKKTPAHFTLCSHASSSEPALFPSRCDMECFKESFVPSDCATGLVQTAEWRAAEHLQYEQAQMSDTMTQSMRFVH